MSWRALLAGAAVAALCGSAAAHGGLPAGGDAAWHQIGWLDLLVIGPLLAVTVAYPRGLIRLWRRAGAGRGINFTQAGAFALGLGTLYLALVSPLEGYAEELLSAHMVQHALLIAVAPPLLLAGRPDTALSFALTGRWRRALARSAGLRRLGTRLGFLMRPLPAAALHGIVLWLWHAPFAFQAALLSPALHVLEHATFFVTAMLFWRSLEIARRSRATAPVGIAAAFLTLLHGGFLGALMTFTPRPIYPIYTETAAAWGIDALTDQQLAGLIMWVPLGAVYLAAGLSIAGRLIGADGALRLVPPPEA